MVLSAYFRPMNRAYLLLGGNMGDRVATLTTARSAIRSRLGSIEKASAYYETAAWGNTDQPDFLNQVLLLKTAVSPFVLMQTLLDIEIQMGRVRAGKYDPRTIDIDILFFNDLVIDQPDLQIPHPRLQQRRFVLTPLREIAPDLVHPVVKQSISQLLLDCTDPLDVKKFYLSKKA
jgi:2-amino-4-hydroxy-6-hydroxymethyldihydropteridine diphosphokinase